MDFRKISDHELRCVVSVEEIRANGLEVSDLLKRSDKTYEFFEYLVAEGQEETGFEKTGPMSVEGVYANGSLELIFRSMEGFDGDVLDADVDADLEPDLPDLNFDRQEILKLLQVRFTELDRLCAFCRLFPYMEHVPSALYQMAKGYALVLNLDDCTKEEIGTFCMLANEYGSSSVYGDLQASQVMEHGRFICDDALYSLHMMGRA
jgi:negative regulator of genetic competence, sporulation and motility